MPFFSLPVLPPAPLPLARDGSIVVSSEGVGGGHLPERGGQEEKPAWNRREKANKTALQRQKPKPTLGSSLARPWPWLPPEATLSKKKGQPGHGSDSTETGCQVRSHGVLTRGQWLPRCGPGPEQGRSSAAQQSLSEQSLR